jgi:hypothetical protein
MHTCTHLVVVPLDGLRLRAVVLGAARLEHRGHNVIKRNALRVHRCVCVYVHVCVLACVRARVRAGVCRFRSHWVRLHVCSS